MPEIQLTRGMVTWVDEEDYHHLRLFKWRAKKNGLTFYAVRTRPKYAGGGLVQMHRVILDAGPGQIVDHANGDGLDNRRANLRIVSARDNARNRQGLPGNRVSKYKGVHKRNNGKWRACLKVDGKTHHLGTYPSEVMAAMAYDAAAKRIHGRFARLNFPRGG